MAGTMLTGVNGGTFPNQAYAPVPGDVITASIDGIGTMEVRVQQEMR